MLTAFSIQHDEGTEHFSWLGLLDVQLKYRFSFQSWYPFSLSDKPQQSNYLEKESLR